MKASGASEKLQSGAKAAPAKAVAAQAPPDGPALAKSAAAKAAPPKPAAAQSASLKAAVPKAVAGKPAAAKASAAPAKAAAPDAKSANASPATAKAPTTATAKPAASAPAAPKPATAPATHTGAAKAVAVNTASVRSQPAVPPLAPPSPVPSAPAAAAAMPAKAPPKPQIETNHIVTIPATDIAVPRPPVMQAADSAAVAKPIDSKVGEAKVSEPVARPVAPPMNGRPAPISRASNKDESFSEGDFVVYPTHGVGKVEKIAKEEIAGHHLELIHITFEENRMTLRVPVSKARSAGLRRLSTRKMFDEALAVLKGRARIKRTMWSRRAQEYEAKINSGDPMSIAEVVRDLHRNAGQPDQSFSERQIYEAAMDRLAAELGALDLTDKNTALVKLGNFLKAL